MSQTAIRVDAVSKRYRIGVREKKSDTLSGKLANLFLSPVENFKRLRSMNRFHENDTQVHWALKEVSFSVSHGEVLGIIGHNGAGKSTLLKILSRITPPSAGEIEISGRVSSLLEVGTGFHPELTGRDNIYMNGTIHGMRRREIDRKLEEIIDFSGIEKYIDTPVKFYSSGMKVRLGFAVAAHLEPEILIIDEVLAVGDAEFQNKCLGKMRDVAGMGRTVLFVSHDMGAVKNLCPETIILKGGSLFARDETEKAILRYIDDLSSAPAKTNSNHASVQIKNLFVQGEQVNQKIILDTSRDLQMELQIENLETEREITFGLDILNGFGTKLIHLRSDGSGKYKLEKGLNRIVITSEAVPFLSGTYHVNVWMGEYKGKRFWEYPNLFLFEVIPANPFNDHQSHLKNALLSPATTFTIN